MLHLLLRCWRISNKRKVGRLPPKPMTKPRVITQKRGRTTALQIHTMKTQTIRIQKRLIPRLKRIAKRNKLSVCEYVSNLLEVLK